VKEAIYLVLKLEILDRARKHLEAAAQEYRKELKQVSSAELRNLLDADEKARAERAKIEKRRAELEAEIESARRKIVEIEQRLRETENAKVLQQQRDRIERDLKMRRSEQEATVGQLRELATSGYLVGAKPAMGRALQILDQKRERGEIPSSIRQQFVQDLIAQMRCVCGRPFTEGSLEHRQLLSLLSTRLPGSLEDDVLDTSAALRGFGERIQRHLSDLDTAMKRRTSLVDLIKDLEAELDDVERQLRGSPLEEISRLERQRQDFRADVDSYNIEIGSLEERDKKLEETITQLEKQIAKARKDEQRERLLSLKLDLAQRAADAIRDMYQVFADDMRERIEAKTKEIFKLLVWKGSHFQDVKLGSDFNLEVIDRYGLPARPELSAGERQVLSLSFITAMSRVSEEEAPLVMDTPFGRLSSQHRNSITEHLPDLSDQLILFVTDEELRDQARKNLEPRIGAEYRLEFDAQTSCTEIAEVRP
jgi:DNA sulfur modification protein DndD